MKKIIMLNASPKGKKASSFKFLNELKAKIEENQIECNLEMLSYTEVMKDNDKSNELFKKILECDAFFLAFPLYVDTLPAITQDFVERYNHFISERETTKVQDLYTIINCGFPEPEHTTVAFEVIQNFAKQVGINCRYNLGIGMGPLAGQIPVKLGLMKQIEKYFDSMIEQLKKPITSSDFNNKIEYSSPTFGFFNIFKKFLYIKVASFSWKKEAEKNKVKDLLYAKPYKEI